MGTTGDPRPEQEAVIRIRDFLRDRPQRLLEVVFITMAVRGREMLSKEPSDA